MAKKETFREKCERVADSLDLGEVLFFGDPGPTEAFEDDGNLHVRQRGKRAVFDVGNGQSLSASVQNENTRKVLRLLGMTKYIGAKNLLDEFDDDEDDCCPECGRPR